MDFSHYEAQLNQVIFDRLGIPAEIRNQQGDLLGSEVRVIFDQDTEVRDDNGMITETRTEVGLPSSLKPQRGYRITLTGPGTEWELLKKISDDGQESRWIGVPK